MPTTLYASFDIEASGPSPVKNSMLQLGICFLDETGQEAGSLSINIREHDDSVIDPDTAKFWERNQEQWTRMQVSQVSPKKAMSLLTNFLEHFRDCGNEIEWVAKPASFDWTFLKTYYDRWGDGPSLGFKCRCLSEALKSTATILGTTKSELEKKIVQEHAIPRGNEHDALDDARFQGQIFIRLLEMQKKLRTH